MEPSSKKSDHSLDPPNYYRAASEIFLVLIFREDRPTLKLIIGIIPQFKGHFYKISCIIGINGTQYSFYMRQICNCISESLLNMDS